MLTNDFFVNLLDMSTTWKATAEDDDVFEGRDRATGALKWTGNGLIYCETARYTGNKRENNLTIVSAETGRLDSNSKMNLLLL